MRNRVKGFVVGKTNGPPKDPGSWRVRVKDPDSPNNGQKLVVASLHEPIVLAQGLNVNFAIGSVDDDTGKPVLRAVDLQLE